MTSHKEKKSFKLNIIEKFMKIKRMASVARHSKRAKPSLASASELLIEIDQWYIDIKKTVGRGG